MQVPFVIQPSPLPSGRSATVLTDAVVSRDHLIGVQSDVNLYKSAAISSRADAQSAARITLDADILYHGAIINHVVTNAPGDFISTIVNQHAKPVVVDTVQRILSDKDEPLPVLTEIMKQLTLINRQLNDIGTKLVRVEQRVTGVEAKLETLDTTMRRVAKASEFGAAVAAMSCNRTFHDGSETFFYQVISEGHDWPSAEGLPRLRSLHTIQQLSDADLDRFVAYYELSNCPDRLSKQRAIARYIGCIVPVM